MSYSSIMKIENDFFSIEGVKSSRVPLPKEIEDECPPGEIVLFVEKGKAFDKVFVNRVARIAITKTREISPENRCDFSDKELLVNFSHALEHLVIVDLFERLGLKVEDFDGKTIGKTATSFNLSDQEVTFFWIRGDVAKTNEVKISVKNAARLILSDY